MKLAMAVALAGALAGCAHQRMTHRDGCWVREMESRWGDTREVVTVCAPRRPSMSHDPLVRAAEACLYQAQLGWYGDAIERLRRDGAPPATFDWNAATARCLEAARDAGLAEVEKLTAHVQSLEARRRELAEENRELRAALVTCAEKTPSAVAEAHSSSDSGADSDAASERVAGGGEERPARARAATPAGAKPQPKAAAPSKPCPVVAEPAPPTTKQ